MNDRFIPINVGKVAPAPTIACASLLEPSRMNVMFAAMDDCAEYAQTLPVHVKVTDYDALTTLADRRETTLRRMVNDHDQAEALEFLSLRGELSDELSERISEVAMEFAEKRLNRAEPQAISRTTNYIGIAQDACAALYEVVQSCKVPGNYDVFSEVDVNRWASILRRAGYREKA